MVENLLAFVYHCFDRIVIHGYPPAPNLVVNSELVRHGVAGFGFFSFTPFGVPVLILGIVYMLFARRWLAADNEDTETPGRPSLRKWIKYYRLADREYRLRVTERSPLVGKTIQEMDLRGSSGANILAIERMARLSSDIIQPLPHTELKIGDIMLVDLAAPGVDMAALRQRFALEEMPLSGAYFANRSQEIGMAELVVPAESRLVGRTVIEARFRTNYGLTVVGLRRGRVAHERGLINEALRIGDTLLVIGPWKDIRSLQAEREDLFILNLPAELDDVLPAASRAPQALASLALVVALMVSGVVPNVQAALIGCLLMGALGCVDLNSAYRSINWQSLVLIVGMLPFSAALQRTGGVDLAANGMLALIGGAGIHAVLATLFGVTALLGMFISNTATAVLMAPVALAIAKDLHASPYPFAMIVALAASAAFMTPVSSPVNTLVVTPGNYRFADFVRVGVPFTVIVLIVTVLLVPWLLPP
jgi:di/tricarboxylate transporter